MTKYNFTEKKIVGSHEKRKLRAQIASPWRPGAPPGSWGSLHSALPQAALAIALDHQHSSPSFKNLIRLR